MAEAGFSSSAAAAVGGAVAAAAVVVACASWRAAEQARPLPPPSRRRSGTRTSPTPLPPRKVIRMLLRAARDVGDGELQAGAAAAAPAAGPPPRAKQQWVPGGRPMVEVARPLFRAALCGDADAVTALLESGAPLGQRSSRGRSLLGVLRSLRRMPEADEAALAAVEAVLRGVGATEEPATLEQAAHTPRSWRHITSFELFDMVLAVDPSDLEALAGRQRAAAALRSWAPALLDAAEVVGRRPDDASMWLAKAQAYEALGLFTAAHDAATDGLRQSAGPHADGYPKERRSLTAFLRQPWIVPDRRAAARGDRLQAGAAVLQRAFHKLRQRKFQVRLQQHMATIVAAADERQGSLRRTMTNPRAVATAGAALAAFGISDSPSAAAYVAAVLEGAPLGGRGSLSEILEHVNRIAGQGGARSLLGLSSGAVAVAAAEDGARAAVLGLLRGNPCLFERCGADEWVLAGASVSIQRQDVVEAFNRRRQQPSSVDLDRPVRGTSHVAQRKAPLERTMCSPWSEGWAEAWQEEAALAAHRRIVRRCNLTDTRFADESFRPHSASGIQDDARHQLDPAVVEAVAPRWRRLYDIASADGGRPVLFEESVDASEVEQGLLGDCWLAAALSIVTQQPLLLHALFAGADVRAGVYTVRLFHDGHHRFITVDDFVPVLASSGLPVFAHAKSRQELWVPILEKAFAKLYGSYAAIESGQLTDALVCLTAGLPKRLLTAPRGTRVRDRVFECTPAWSTQLFHKLLDLVGARQDGDGGQGLSHVLMGAGSVGPDRLCTPLHMQGIIPGHAYALLGAFDLCHGGSDAKQQLLQLRNPWGQGRPSKPAWRGAWSDGSDEWSRNPGAKQAVGYEQKHDWSFFICMEDFCQLFGCVYVCDVLPADWHVATAHGAW